MTTIDLSGIQHRRHVLQQIIDQDIYCLCEPLIFFLHDITPARSYPDLIRPGRSNDSLPCAADVVDGIGDLVIKPITPATFVNHLSFANGDVNMRARILAASPFVHRARQFTSRMTLSEWSLPSSEVSPPKRRRCW